MMLGNGLLGIVLGVRAELEGYSTPVTGAVMAGYFVGFLFGALLTPRLLQGVGHIRVYAALASLASTATLIHALNTHPAVWGAMRIITGFSLAGLYIVAEGWLNDSATNETRGRLLSIYMIIVTGGFAVGQLLLSIGDPAGFSPFIAASVLISLAVIPVTLSVNTAPDTTQRSRLSFMAIWRSAPIGIVAGLGTGIVDGAILGMGAVYGSRVGMSVTRISVFMGVILAGGAMLQFPIGAWSDRFPRRRVLLIVTTAAAMLGLSAALLDPLSIGMLVAVFVLGGLAFPMYAIALSHINDMFPPGNAVAISSAFVLVTGFGAIVGPLAAGWLIDGFGPASLFWLLAGTHATIGAFAVVRILTTEGIPLGDQRRFLQVPARTGGNVDAAFPAEHTENSQ